MNSWKPRKKKTASLPPLHPQQRSPSFYIQTPPPSTLSCLPPLQFMWLCRKNFRDMEKDNSTKVKQIERASYLPTWCKIAQSNWRCRRRGAEAVGGHKHHKGGKRQKKISENPSFFHVQTYMILSCSANTGVSTTIHNNDYLQFDF